MAGASVLLALAACFVGIHAQQVLCPHIENNEKFCDCNADCCSDLCSCEEAWNVSRQPQCCNGGYRDYDCHDDYDDESSFSGNRIFPILIIGPLIALVIYRKRRRQMMMQQQHSQGTPPPAVQMQAIGQPAGGYPAATGYPQAFGGGAVIAGQPVVGQPVVGQAVAVAAVPAAGSESAATVACATPGAAADGAPAVATSMVTVQGSCDVNGPGGGVGAAPVVAATAIAATPGAMPVATAVAVPAVPR